MSSSAISCFCPAHGGSLVLWPIVVVCGFANCSARARVNCCRADSDACNMRLRYSCPLLDMAPRVCGVLWGPPRFATAPSHPRNKGCREEVPHLAVLSDAVPPLVRVFVHCCLDRVVPCSCRGGGAPAPTCSLSQRRKRVGSAQSVSTMRPSNSKLAHSTSLGGAPPIQLHALPNPATLVGRKQTITSTCGAQKSDFVRFDRLIALNSPSWR